MKRTLAMLLLFVAASAHARTWPPEPVAGGGTVEDATTTTAGIVELATNREDAASVVVQGNDTRLDPFVGSGASHRTGLVPDPGASAGTDAFLREDGTWANPTDLFDPGVEIDDETARALSIGESTNDYIVVNSIGAGFIDAYKTVQVDTLAEHTSANGITVDGLNLKDSGINATGLTTGTGYLGLTDNLAQAWSVKEGSNNYEGFVTTNGAERVAFSKPVTTSQGVSSGTARVVGGIHTIDPTDSAAITGATEVITVFNKNCPLEADTLNRVGAYLEIHAQFLASNMAAADTTTFTLRANNTTIGATNTTVAPQDEGPVTFNGWCETDSTGSTGTLTCGGTFIVSGARGASTPVVHSLFSGSTTTSTITLDLTSLQTIRLANTWQGSANDADSIRQDFIMCRVTG